MEYNKVDNLSMAMAIGHNIDIKIYLLTPFSLTNIDIALGLFYRFNS